MCASSTETPSSVYISPSLATSHLDRDALLGVLLHGCLEYGLVEGRLVRVRAKARARARARVRVRVRVRVKVRVSCLKVAWSFSLVKLMQSCSSELTWSGRYREVRGDIGRYREVMQSCSSVRVSVRARVARAS